MKVRSYTSIQDTLTQCLLSIQKQEYDDIVHYVFIDGYEHKENYKSNALKN